MADPIPDGVELPNPQDSIDHEDVAPIEEVKYDDASKSSEQSRR